MLVSLYQNIKVLLKKNISFTWMGKENMYDLVPYLYHQLGSVPVCTSTNQMPSLFIISFFYALLVSNLSIMHGRKTNKHTMHSHYTSKICNRNFYRPRPSIIYIKMESVANFFYKKLRSTNYHVKFFVQI